MSLDVQCIHQGGRAMRDPLYALPRSIFVCNEGDIGVSIFRPRINFHVYGVQDDHDCKRRRISRHINGVALKDVDYTLMRHAVQCGAHMLSWTWRYRPVLVYNFDHDRPRVT